MVAQNPVWAGEIWL